MTLQERKIPIITGVNDVPATVGQANYPNDSLLCANYNSLIDTELTSLETAVTTATGNITILQTDVTALQNNSSEASISPITPSEASIDYIGNVYYEPNGNYIELNTGLNFKLNIAGSWESIYFFNEFYTLSAIDGVLQTLNSDVSFTATRSGANLEFLSLAFRINNIPAGFIIYPVLFTFDYQNTALGFQQTYNALLNAYNYGFLKDPNSVGVVSVY